MAAVAAVIAVPAVALVAVVRTVMVAPAVRIITATVVAERVFIALAK